MKRYFQTHQNKNYELINVEKECFDTSTTSCGLCDLKNECLNDILKGLKCRSYHCYKYVKEGNTIMDKKGKCPRCGSESFATERRPNGDSVCSKCNFSGKTTEFYKIEKEPEKSKMKTSELSFKLITNSEYRNKTIIELMRTIGFPILDINLNGCAFYVNNNNYGFFNEINSVFDNMLLKEVTFEEAIKLLESCEPEVKEPTGKFVEYDISPDGGIPFQRDRDDLYYPWQAPDRIENQNCIFAGWLWVHPDEPRNNCWSTLRMGIWNNELTPTSHMWEYPIIPKKVRFWVKE